MLVVRELMFGPKRFSDLRASLPGISANVLTQRLEGLEAASILIRRKLPSPASAWVYELSEWGRELEPVFQALGRWAARSPSHDPSRPFGAASLLLSFRTMLDADLAREFDATIGFQLGNEYFVGRLHEGQFDVSRNDAGKCDFTMSGEARAIAAVVYGGVTLEEGEASLGIVITGDRALAKRFVSLFPLPAPAPKLAG